MLTIKCPVCGVEGDETDFHYGHEAHIARPATSDPDNISNDQQRDYLFMRHNPRGLHFERWRCERGCGKWFHAARDTVTMEFKAYYGITEMPPEELMRAATGEWAEFFSPKTKAFRVSQQEQNPHPGPPPQAGEGVKGMPPSPQAGEGAKGGAAQ